MKKPQRLLFGGCVLVLLALVAGCAAPAVESEQPAGSHPAGTPAVTMRPTITTAEPPAAAAEIAPAVEGASGGDKEGPAVVTEPVRAAAETTPGAAPRIAFESTQTDVEAYQPEPFFTMCLFAGTGATMGLDNQRLNFTCAQAGDVSIGLFGDVQTGAQGWMIARMAFTSTADGFKKLGSEMTHVEGILLHDGMRCFAAAAAERQSVDGKTVEYLCASENGKDSVLLGDITQGDEGWLITRAAMQCSGGSCSLLSSSPALIDGLMVRK
jgi:hypothetical protein